MQFDLETNIPKRADACSKQAFKTHHREELSSSLVSSSKKKWKSRAFNEDGVKGEENQRHIENTVLFGTKNHL